jgi:predicted dehydrogenase
MYRVGVVGLSGISAGRAPAEAGEVLQTPLPTSHVSAYAALAQTTEVAVCDLKPDVLAAFEERWGDVFPDARAYTDVGEMLDRERLDILSVVTPDHAHADIVVAAADRGVRGIACEKPLATTLADCDRMIAACEANGATLSVDHTRRFRPPYQAARQAIRRGAIGPVQRVIASMGGPRAMLFRNGTHLIDGVCFFAESAPEWVFAELDPGFETYFAYRGDGGRDPATDPGASGYIHFRNGVRAFVNCSKGQSPAFILQVQPAAVEAVEFLSNLTHGLQLVPPAAQGELLIKGQTVFEPQGAYRIPVLREAGVRFEPIDFPRGPQHKAAPYKLGSMYSVIGEQGEIDVAMDHAVLRRGTHAAELLSPPVHMRTGIAAYLEELIRVMEHGGETTSPPREARKTVEIIVGFLRSQEQGSARGNLPLPPGS